MALSLAELARVVGGEVRGDAALSVHRVAPLDVAGEGDLAFFYDQRWRKHLGRTRATAVLLDAESADACPVAAVVVPDPYVGYARAAAALHPEPRPAPGVAAGAWVDPGAQVAPSASVAAGAVVEEGVTLGEEVVVGPGCVVMAGAVVGDGTRLVASVTIGRGVRVGRRCIVHPGAVIGADGFGLAREGSRWIKIPQLGSVQIGDDVEIGANSTIDRGAQRDTVLGRGVKVDNLVQIGHNVQIGDDTAIAGCVGIAGSTRIGRRCMIGGGAGIGGHLEIADDVSIAGMAMVTKSIRRPGVYASGWPAREARAWWRLVAALERLVAPRTSRGERGR